MILECGVIVEILFFLIDLLLKNVKWLRRISQDNVLLVIISANHYVIIELTSIAISDPILAYDLRCIVEASFINLRKSNDTLKTLLYLLSSILHVDYSIKIIK